MAGGILSMLLGGGDTTAPTPGLLDAAGYMDPETYDRARRSEGLSGLFAGLLAGSGPSLEPRNFWSALGTGLQGQQKFASQFDENALHRAQGMRAYQQSALERQKLKLATDIYGQALNDPAKPGTAPAAPGAAPGGPGAGGTGSAPAEPGAGQLSFSQVNQLALDAGFSPDKAPTMAAIVMAESSGDPGAINPKDPGGSYGLPQINRAAHGDLALEALNNPARSLQIAFDVSKGGTDFTPWTTYTKGSYKKFLQTPGPLPTQELPEVGVATETPGGGRAPAVGALSRYPQVTSYADTFGGGAPAPAALTAGAPAAAPPPGALPGPKAAPKTVEVQPDGTALIDGVRYPSIDAWSKGAAPVTTLTPSETPLTPSRNGLARVPILAPTATPDVTSTPGGTNGIDPRKGAALEQILRGVQNAQAGTPIEQLRQVAGDTAAADPTAAPAPAGITGAGGVLGRAAANAAASAPGTAAQPAAAAPSPGAFPQPPALPPIPAVIAPEPLPPPPASPALRPLMPSAAAPAVQLSPEQAARTQRAQRMAIALDLIGVTVPKFIADEAGIDVAARSAAAQKAATQPFDVQMKQLENDMTVANKRWDALTDQQKETLAASRGLTKAQFEGQIANIHERFKSELDLFTAGPKAADIAEAQLGPKKKEITFQTDEDLRKNWDTPKEYKITDPMTLQERTVIMTPRQASGGAGPPSGTTGTGPTTLNTPPGATGQAAQNTPPPMPGFVSGAGPLATAEATARGAQLGKLNETIDDNARAARTTLPDLKNMQTAAQGLAMRGIFADQTQFANQVMNALTGEQKDRVASYEMVTKNSEKLVRDQTRLSDNQPAAIQLVMTRNSMPTPRTSEIGFDGVVSQMIGAHEYGLYVQQEKVKWQATHPSLQGFEAQLPVSPYAFMVYRMPPHLEDQLMARLRAGGAQGAKEAAMLRDQIGILKSQGYGD